MKKDFSSQGLSEIVEESDREEFDNPRHLLARLSNQEFLSQYVYLDPFVSISQQYQDLIHAPINPQYKKFTFDAEADTKQAIRELRSSLI